MTWKRKSASEIGESSVRMTTNGHFKIDLSENFKQLSRPPIVEAVLHWRSLLDAPLSRNELSDFLRTYLPDYPVQKDHFATQFQFQIPLADDLPPTAPTKEGGWTGLRLMSEDGSNIAIFSGEGLGYSRLAPYLGWEKFEAEGQRLWKLYEEIAKPDSVERLGLRFINKIPMRPEAGLEEYLREPPTMPAHLPLISFLYQSAFEVKNEGLLVNVVKTLQDEPANNVALILDVDVFTREGLSKAGERSFDALVPKMRWLKNKVFSELLQPELIDSFT